MLEHQDDRYSIGKDSVAQAIKHLMAVFLRTASLGNCNRKIGAYPTLIHNVHPGRLRRKLPWWILESALISPLLSKVSTEGISVGKPGHEDSMQRNTGEINLARAKEVVVKRKDLTRGGEDVLDIGTVAMG